MLISCACSSRGFLFLSALVFALLSVSLFSFAQQGIQQQQQQGSPASCVRNEQSLKDSVKLHLLARIHPADPKKETFAFTSPLFNGQFPHDAVPKCIIGGIQSKSSVTYPVYSLQHLDLAPSTSPFYADSYRSQQQQHVHHSVLRGFDKFVVVVEDSVPVLGSIIKALRLPVVMVSTHVGSLVGAVKVAVSAPANAGSISAMKEQLAPQTRHLLQFFNFAGDAIRYAFFRQIVDVYVVNSNTKKTIHLQDKVFDAFAVPLPSGLSKCSDITSPYEVKNAHGTSKSVNCRDRFALAIFHSPTEFVNSLFGWVPRLFEKYLVGSSQKKNNNNQEESDQQPSCTVDVTLNSAETAPQCVVVACSGLERCSLLQPEVRFEQRLELDVTVFALLIAGFLFGVLRPYASSSTIVRWILCSLFGVAVLVVMLGLLMYKLVEHNNTAKLGFVLAAGVSGLWAASSGLVGHLISLLVELIFSNWIAASAFGIMCVGSVYIAHRFFGSSMSTIIDVTMASGKWGLLASACLRNPELCSVLLFTHFVLKYVVFHGILSLLLFAFLGTTFGVLFDRDPDRPRDTFPDSVTKLKAHEIPSKALANRIGWGLSEAERHKLYVAQGNEYTRKQMDGLFKEIRKHPEKYAHRLSNANQTFRAAGVGTGGGDGDEN